MKVLTCSRHFPKGHSKQGQPTYFVEKIWNMFRDKSFALPDNFIPWTDNYALLLSGEQYLNAMTVREIKGHTIRASSRFKPGDMVSLRVWSGLPRQSKQIEFAQVEVKKVWEIEINAFWFINGRIMEHNQVVELAKNDGLAYEDFVNWFKIHPKKTGDGFRGQVICWNNSIEYSI